MTQAEKLDRAIDRIYNLSQLWSINDLMCTHIREGNHDKVWALTPTIEALLEKCRPDVDAGIAEEGMQELMNLHAANKIREAANRFSAHISDPIRKSLLSYAQAVEDGNQ